MSKNIRNCLFVLLSLVLLISPGCTSQSASNAELPIEITDQLGRLVKLDKIPQRIVSLAPSNTEILFALGLGDKVVGVTRYCNYPEEAKEKAQVGGFADPDLEKIVALEPDLILAFGTLQESLVTELEERGQTVFWIYPHSINDVLESFESIGKLTGTSVTARQLRNEIEERIEQVQTKFKDIPEQERPTVFRVMGLDPPATVGGASYQTDVYRLAGGRNIFADTDKDYFQLDLQTLIELDPDIIVICGEDEEEAKRNIKDQKGWEELTAVKNDRIAVISCDLICRPSPRIAQTIEKLATKFGEMMSLPIEVSDQLGRSVKLDQIPQRIISLAPSNTEILFALGLGDKVVGVTNYCNYPPEVKDKPSIGGFSTPDIEKIKDLSPDLILATSIHEKTYIPRLEKLRLTVFALAPKNLEEVLEAIALTGKITGKEKEATELVTEMRNRIKAVTDKTENLSEAQNPRVLYITWHDPLMTAGAGTLHDELIKKAGGVNVAGDLNDYAVISLEAVIDANPEVMIAGVGMGTGADAPLQFALTESRLRNTDARLNNRVYPVDVDIVGRAGPRIVEALEQFASFIHPELFGDNK